MGGGVGCGGEEAEIEGARAEAEVESVVRVGED